MTRRGPVVVRARRRATACLDLKRQPPLLGSLQLVHATRQISYLFIQCHHSCTRKDAFQRHQERAEPTHDSETADCRSRSNKKHQRGKRKQAGGQCQGSVARQCCDQDWKKEKGERGNAETLQKLTQVFDMLSHYAIPAAREPALLRRSQGYQAHSPPHRCEPFDAARSRICTSLRPRAGRSRGVDCLSNCQSGKSE